MKEREIRKKYLSLILAATMVFAMLPAFVFTQPAKAETNPIVLTYGTHEPQGFSKIEDAIAAYNSITEDTAVTITISGGTYSVPVSSMLIEEDSTYPNRFLTITAKEGETVTIKPNYSAGNPQSNSTNGIFCISGLSSYNGPGVKISHLNFDMSENPMTSDKTSWRVFAIYALAGGSGRKDALFPEVGKGVDGAHRYAHNITIENCTFTGPSGKLASAFGANQSNCQPKDITIKDCTGTNLNCWYNGYGTNIRIENCTGTNFLCIGNYQAAFAEVTLKNVDGTYFAPVTASGAEDATKCGTENGMVYVIGGTLSLENCDLVASGKGKATANLGIINVKSGTETVSVINSTLDRSINSANIFDVYNASSTAASITGNNVNNNGFEENVSKTGGFNFMIPVAQIGNNKYSTLQAAITAASQMERSADNRVTIDIIGTCEGLSSGADIQYVTFKGHEGGSMNGYQASTNAQLKGTHFEDVTFNGTFQIQACDNTCDDDIVFSNCTFNGSNTTGSAIMIQRYETQTINNLTLTGNNFKNYTSSAVVLNLSSKTSLDSKLFVYNNNFDNIGYNAVQALNFDKTTISANTVTNTASSAFNISGCKNTTVINNTVDLKDGTYAVKNVTGMTYLIGNTLTKGTSKISDFGRNAEVKAGGTATLDAYIDIESGKVYGGLVLKNSAEELAASEMKTGCSAAKIGEGLYLVGVDASASSYKLTGGLYIDNPLPYVAEGYTVQPSGNQDYPYEVIKLKSGEKEKKEIVVEQKTEPVISEKIEEPAEIAVATAVLEDTKVTGVSDALTEKGKDKIIQAAIDDKSEITKEIIDGARMVDVSITVEAEVVAVQTVTSKTEKEKVIEFELSPYAVVTATASDGTQVSSDVIKVDNAYLAKTETKAIKVVLGSEFEPKQAVHIREDGVNEVFEKGTKASYADRTFVYDKEQKTVTLEITQFSVVRLLADEKYSTVAFDANGGTGIIEAVSVEKGTKLTLPENSFKAPSGKKFKSWSIKGQTYNPGSKITVTENITVKAEWEGGVVTGDFTSFWGYLMIAGFALAAIGYGLIRLGKKRRQ